jgi:hypothetical protein
VVAAAGIWAVVTYFWPAHETPKVECVQQGVAIGGNVSGSTVTNTASGGTATAGRFKKMVAGHLSSPIPRMRTFFPNWHSRDGANSKSGLVQLAVGALLDSPSPPECDAHRGPRSKSRRAR